MRAAQRDLGPTARTLTRVSVVCAAGVYMVGTGDLIPGGLFLIVFLLSLGHPVFEPFRRLETAPAAALRASVFLLPVIESIIRTRVFGHEPFADLYEVLAHPIMIAMIIRGQSLRLPTSGHLQLLGGGAALVFGGALAGSSRLLPPMLAIWITPTTAALVRIHLESEVNRTLVLARIRTGDQDRAEEVSGRRRALKASMVFSISLIGVQLIVGGLFLAWFTPQAARGVSAAWGAITGGDGEGPDEAGLPESPDEKPPFAIPRGVVGYLPFGPRLERDDFLLRREQDGITVLLREARLDQGPGLASLIRGECYDYLNFEGRWIRSRRRERVVRDENDGVKDDCLTLDGSTVPHTSVVECLIPPGPDRTLYVLSTPTRLWLPRMVMDGTGNYLDAGGRSPTSSYIVEAREPILPQTAVLTDPGPEFLLLPDHLDREKLAALVDPYITFAQDDFTRIETVTMFLRTKFLNLPDDAPERADVEVSSPPPDRLDVSGFLFTRRWGSSIDFATAEAMLLRSIGIPCRLATGYLRGTWLTHAEFFVYRAGDLHAWVEVPVEGYGWVPIDPTPPEPELSDEELGEVLQRPPEERGDEAARLQAEEETKSLVGRMLDAIDGWVSSLLPGDRKSTSGGKVVAWIVLIGVAVVILRILMAVTEKGRQALTGQLERADGVVRVLFYLRLLRILAKRGMRRRPTETPLEFARKVTGAWGMEFAEVQRLTNAFCATRYGSRVIGAEKEGELLRRANDFGELLAERDRNRRLEREDARQPTRRRLWPFGALLILAVLSLGGAVLAATPRELVKDLGDPDQDVRLTAREELALLKEKAIPALLDALAPPATTDRGSEVEQLIRELDADEFEVRKRATRLLKELGPVARPEVERAVSSASPEVARRARDILRYMDGDGKLIYAEAEKARERRRGEALLLLGVSGDARAVDAVLQAGLTWPPLESRAAGALVRLARRHPERLYVILDGPDPVARTWALKALAAARPAGLSGRFARLLEDPDPAVRRMVSAALVTAGVVEETDRARLLLRREMRAEAKAALYRVLKDCPGYLEAVWILADLLEKDGDYRAALEVLGSAAEVDLETSLRIVTLTARIGEVAEAFDIASNLLGMFPDDYRVHLMSATVNLQRDPPEPRIALARAEQALKLAPGEAAAWAMLGRILGEHFEDIAGARNAFRQAVMLDSENEELRTELKKYLGR